MRTSFVASALVAVLLSACAPSTPALPPEPPAAVPVAGRVEIVAAKEGFVPAKIAAPAGKPLTLVFTRTEPNTCMTGVHFPELGIEKEIPVGARVEVEVTPKAGGTIAFQCPMGMGKSAIVSVN